MKPTPVLLMIRQLGAGGTERQLTELAKALDRGRFAPHVCCFFDGFRSEEIRAAGVPILTLPIHSFASTHAARRAWELRSYLTRERIEVVHTFDYPANIFGATAARLWRAPVVLSSQRSHRELRTPKYRRLLRMTDRLVDAVVVNSESVAQHLREDEGVPPHRIRLCYNGLDARVFHRGDRRASGDEVTIGVVAVLRPEKGLEHLVDGFASLAKETPYVRLLVVGSGPMREALMERARVQGVGERCHFEPATPEVAPWLRRMDVFVLPSLSEALSNSLMEAMACGCCAIASRVGGNPELVRHGETGLLFPSGDAAALAGEMRRVVTDAALRQRLADAAAERMAQEFTIEASARRMAEIYEEFLTSRSASGSTKGR